MSMVFVRHAEPGSHRLLLRNMSSRQSGNLPSCPDSASPSVESVSKRHTSHWVPACEAEIGDDENNEAACNVRQTVFCQGAPQHASNIGHGG